MALDAIESHVSADCDGGLPCNAELGIYIENIHDPYEPDWSTYSPLSSYGDSDCYCCQINETTQAVEKLLLGSSGGCSEHDSESYIAVKCCDVIEYYQQKNQTEMGTGYSSLCSYGVDNTDLCCAAVEVEKHTWERKTSGEPPIPVGDDCDRQLNESEEWFAKCPEVEASQYEEDVDTGPYIFYTVELCP